MRTISEICDAVRHGEQPTPDECFYTIRALEALTSMDGLALRNSLRCGDNEAVSRLWEDHFNRHKRAGALSPKDYLGPDNDPRAEGVQRRIRTSEKLFAAAVDGKLPNQTGSAQ